MISSPENDEFEISVFGPSYGESILIHIGNSHWIIVDSCINQRTKKPVPLEYLESIGVDPKESVILIFASHWHDDHIGGLSQIVERCEKADICISDAFSRKEFLTFLRAYGRSPLMEFSGVDELNTIFETIKRNPKRQRIRFLIEDRVIWNSISSVENYNFESEIIALSPSDKAKQQSLLSMGCLIPQSKEDIISKRRIPMKALNDLCVVLRIKINDCVLLLGSDLENNKDPNIGWKRILNKNNPSKKASIFKIPHHGSKTGYNIAVWNELLIQNPIAFLTPFKCGSVQIPKEEEVELIEKHTSRAYSSSGFFSRKSIKRPASVSKTISETVNYLRPIFNNNGQIRVRIKIKEIDSEIDNVGVELLNGAVEVKELYN